MNTVLRDRLDLALEAAWQAGRITLRYFQAGVQPEWKADESPVTVADREAEQKIRQMLERAFPGDGVVGEEYGRQEGTSGYRWLIDPIDGTKAFIQGVPLYGVLIGIETPQGVEAGVVLLPALDELVWAARGEGCWWKGRRAQVSAVNQLQQACLIYTESGSFAKCSRGPAWEALSRGSRVQRGWGDCYGHILVATGRAEACFDPVMNPWDCGPLLPILQEAGGTFTDWQGEATVYGPDAFSTNGLLFPALMEHLRSH
ncbi:MAG: inositol monophosphatase family protein [Candidatus Handelsmanbacteria bacterium]|nr:inositol monophosphatase family protein [Candidatus Handelsmanbacteria bacterium]